MKFDYCKEHQGSKRTDLSCRRIRHDNGMPATQEEIWERLQLLEREIVQLRRGEFICRKCGLRKDGEYEGVCRF